ncbi:MAG: CBS domain-containing protein [Nanoarchaeota archaeon]
MKTGIKVIDAMTRNPIVIEQETSLLHCTKKMLKENVGSVLVKNKDQLKGIITEKDIVTAMAKNLDPKKIKAKDIMTAKLIGISPDNDIYEALLRMKLEDIRRLPVVNNGRLVGLITVKDILKIQPELFDILTEKIRIREARNKPIFGTCENCSSENYLYRVGNKLLCGACK